LRSLSYMSLVLATMFIFRCENPPDTGEDPSDGALWINEVMPTGDPDWFELYNATTTDVDMGGYLVWDDGTVDAPYALPAGTTIPAGGFLVIDAGDMGEGLDAPFKLSSAGETVYLGDENADLLDSMTFPALEDGTSYGRSPDGGETLVVFDIPTPGAAN